MLITASATLYGALNHNRTTVLRAIHKNEIKLEATMVIDGVHRKIVAPADHGQPEQRIVVCVGDTLLAFIFQSIVDQLGPILAHGRKTIAIDNVAFTFVHTGNFFVCEDCKKCGLPKTWVEITAAER